jgi:citronellol/citronellal dehydrogenase
MGYRSVFAPGTFAGTDGGASCNTKVFPLPEHSRSKPYDGFHLAAAPRILDGAKEK